MLCRHDSVPLSVYVAVVARCLELDHERGGAECLMALLGTAQIHSRICIVVAPVRISRTAAPMLSFLTPMLS